jgi:hypothetical protein
LASVTVSERQTTSLIDSLHTDIEDMRHVWLLIGIALSAGWVRNRGAAS